MLRNRESGGREAEGFEQLERVGAVEFQRPVDGGGEKARKLLPARQWNINAAISERVPDAGKVCGRAHSHREAELLRIPLAARNRRPLDAEHVARVPDRGPDVPLRQIVIVELQCLELFLQGRGRVVEFAAGESSGEKLVDDVLPVVALVGGTGLGMYALEYARIRAGCFALQSLGCVGIALVVEEAEDEAVGFDGRIRRR